MKRSLIVGLVGFLAPLALQAATFNVDDTADLIDANTGDGVCQTGAGTCTLRAAVMQSNASAGADTVNLPAGTFNLSIPSGSTDTDPSVGDLDIGSGGLTIVGAGAGATIVNQTITHRVFEIPVDIFFSGTVTFQSFTIQGGNSSGLGGFNQAAAIQVGSRFASRINLYDMVISGNNGAAAVSSRSSLWIERTTITATTGNGVFLTNDSVSPGQYLKDLDVIDSTIDSNTGSGVAFQNAQDGRITNSTISGNGIYGLMGQYTQNAFYITNSTINGNTGNGIAGIGYEFLDPPFPPSFLSPDFVVRNSIVSNNTAGDIRTPGMDANAVLPASQGYNIISDSTGAPNFNQTNDDNNTDPQLLTLALNAPGSTRTHALSGSSPAIGTASASFAPAADQRGVSRPQGAADDKGAYEFVPASADVSVSKTDGVASINAGDPVSYTITVTNNGPDAVAGVNVTDTLPATLGGASWTCVASGGATCGASGTGGIDDMVDLPVSGTATYTLGATLDLTATGSLVNTASATMPASAGDPSPSNNSSTDTNTIVAAPTADLSVSKTNNASTVTAGGQVIYTIVAGNSGPDAVTGATLADTLPTSLTCTYTSVAAGGATGNTSIGGGDLAETLDLPNGATVTYTLTCTLDANASGTLENTATITIPAGTVEPAPANNTATDSDSIIPPDVNDLVGETLGGTGVTISACTELTAQTTTILAGADVTFMAPVVELLNDFIVEVGATFTVVIGVPPECVP